MGTHPKDARAAVIVMAAALVAALLLPVGSAAGRPAGRQASGDGLARALESGEIGRATFALERARSLFDLQGVRARYGSVPAPGPRAATLILAELAMHLRGLRGEDRADAEQLLARPDDDQDDDGDGDFEHPKYEVPAEVLCSPTPEVCVHWVESTADAPPPADLDGDGRPDWVDDIVESFQRSWTIEVEELGYRAPLSDIDSANNGGDGGFDVYVADLDGIFGYVTIDDPRWSDPSFVFWDASTYMVLDNDYTESALSPFNGIAGLQSTVPHELFHSVQCAYDCGEDPWFREGTATWMEEEVYDDLNSPHFYFGDDTPFDGPVLSLDRSAGNAPYGAWIFWRFLSEYLGEGAAHDPAAIRRIWELADGTAAGENQYSLQAVESMLAERGLEFRKVFAEFGAANRLPAAFYEEGATYPRPIFAGGRTFPLTAAEPVNPSFTTSPLRHLANMYWVFRPGRGVSGSMRLKVTVDLPPLERGSEATLVVQQRSGGVTYLPYVLNADGKGVVLTSFGRSAVSTATLVITNASTRFLCWEESGFSCEGEPLDDEGWRARVGARLVR